MSKYFAELDENNVVKRVIVAKSRSWCEESLGGTWKQTYMGSKDHKYAGIGDTWSEEHRDFIPKQPYPSWKLENNEWIPPTPYPNDGSEYDWDETTKSWIYREG